MSTISWGHDTPRQAYYPNGLWFGFDGFTNHSYIGNPIQFNQFGGGVNNRLNFVGNNQSVFPDNNGTYFNGTNYIYVGASTGSNFWNQSTKQKQAA